MRKLALLALIATALGSSLALAQLLTTGVGSSGGIPPSGCILASAGNNLLASAGNCILIQ